MINFNSISYDQIKQELLDYIASKPEYDSWKDLLEGGAGTTMAELQAGLGAFLSFHAMMARREANLFYAKLRSSIYGISDILGYPINRKTAAKLKIKIYCQSAFYWDRETPIGYLSGKPVSLTSSTSFVAGQNDGPGGEGFEVVLGEWWNYTETIDETINFKDIQIVLDDIDYIDNTFFEVRINGTHYATTRYVENLEPDNVLIKTLSDRVMVVFGDDYFGKKVFHNDDILVDYIFVSGDASDYNVENLSLDMDGEVTEGIIVNPLYAEDTTRKTVVVAPGYFASKRRMVTLLDHEYIIMSYTGIISAKAKRYEDGDLCCTILIAYLYSDEHLMTPAEEEQLLEYTDDFRIQGEQIIFVDPEPVYIDAQITVVIEEGSDTARITSEAENAIDDQCLQLGTVFKVGTVIDTICESEGVRRAYITQPRFDKENPYNKYFKRYNLDITFTTNQDSVLEFGDGTGGYL